MPQASLHTIDEQRAAALDAQVQEMQKVIDFEIREYPVEVIVNKFVNGLELDQAELFVPDYQREFIWTKKHQSRFIESILLSLPIPYIFVADVAEGAKEGRLEIVDGSQRVRTLVAFLQGDLQLFGLKKLTQANGLKFANMSLPRQMRFKRKTLRMIELTEQTDEESRREIFDRLNSGGVRIESMEQRRGSHDGPFLAFLENLAASDRFQTLCPVSPARASRAEYLELVLRYFAYCDNYANFTKKVEDFLTEYLVSGNANTTQEKRDMQRRQFEEMLTFVEKYLPNGFKKHQSNTSVPRIRFEALAVGTTLAQRIQPNLAPVDVSSWLEGDEFRLHTRSDASNSRPKVVNRLHFVRDHLLGRPVEYDTGPEKEIEETEGSLI
jgi:hypothetical protein